MSKLTMINMQNCSAVIRAYRDADVSQLTPEQYSTLKKDAELAMNHMAKITSPNPHAVGGSAYTPPKCPGCGYIVQHLE